MILPPWMVRVRHGILRLELLRSLKKLYRNLAIAGVVPMNKVRPRMDAVAHSGTILRANVPMPTGTNVTPPIPVMPAMPVMPAIMSGVI